MKNKKETKANNKVRQSPFCQQSLTCYLECYQCRGVKEGGVFEGARGWGGWWLWLGGPGFAVGERERETGRTADGCCCVGGLKKKIRRRS